MKTLSVYVHIPFCVKKCNYCDFLSAPAEKHVQEEYLDVLIKEIERESVNYKDYTVISIFIGGGTPSVIIPEGISRVLKAVKTFYLLAEDAEISMEVNPGTVDKKALCLYRRAGVNRLSIGLQSADDRELQLLGRIHTYSDFLETYALAWEAGFVNINVDIMAALPGQRIKDYEATLQKVLALHPHPTHISAYSLIIEEGTFFYELYGKESEDMARSGEKQKHLVSEEEERQMYEMTKRMLDEAGYYRYEVSNYSRPGYECQHNLVYWQRGNYAGFGLGASSLVENIRFRNTDNLHEYLVSECKIADRTPLSVKEQMAEFMFLGLRLMRGVKKEDFKKEFGVSMDEVYGEVILENTGKGLLENGASVRLTDSGLDVANYVMAQFLPDE